MTKGEQDYPGMVLMYHGIDPGDGRFAGMDASERAYTVGRQSFLEHLKLIDASPYRITSPESGKRPGSGELWISFDDGWSSDFDIACPALEDRDLAGVFFVTADWVGAAAHVDWSEVRAMADKGMLIGSHGLSHHFLQDCNRKVLSREILESKKIIEAEIRREVQMFSLPGGSGNASAYLYFRRAGYQSVFTSNPSDDFNHEGLRGIGRIAVRSNWTAADFQHLLHQPGKVIEKMAFTARWKNHMRQCLGTRFYRRLHGWFWKK